VPVNPEMHAHPAGTLLPTELMGQGTAVHDPEKYGLADKVTMVPE
jgi:hypothetical protein